MCLNPKRRIAEIDNRLQLLEEREYLLAYVESLKKILSRNPYLDANVGLGYQNFLDFVCGKRFYVDKTHFIPEWLANDARITLITRPRRFGKSMLLRTVGAYSARFRLYRSASEAARGMILRRRCGV